MAFKDVLKEEANKYFGDRRFTTFFVITAILLPLLLLGMIGPSFDNQRGELDVIVFQEGNGSRYASQIIGALETSSSFNVISDFEGDIYDAQWQVGRGVSAVFQIPEDFETRINNAEAGGILLYIDSSDYNLFRYIEQESEAIIEDSVRRVVQMVVEDLETEQAQKATTTDDIGGQAGGLYLKLIEAERKISNADLNTALTEAEILQEDIEDCANCSNSMENSIDTIVGELNYADGQINSAQTVISQSKNISNGLSIASGNLGGGLKTLKKDFLSVPLKVDKQYVYGKSTYIRYLVPSTIATSIFLLLILLTTVSFLSHEKKIMDAHRWRLAFMIRSIGVFLLAILETIYTLLLARFAFGVTTSFNYLQIPIILILLSITSVFLGFVFARTLRTERDLAFLVPMLALPFILLSGIFASTTLLPRYVQYLSYVSPLTYANELLRAVMLRGSTWWEIGYTLAYLGSYAFVGGLALYLFLRKQHKKGTAEKTKKTAEKKPTKKENKKEEHKGFFANLFKKKEEKKKK